MQASCCRTMEQAFHTAGTQRCAEVMGVGRLARLWKFFALSAPLREMWTHASGMMSFAFFSHEGSKTRRFRHWATRFLAPFPCALRL